MSKQVSELGFEARRKIIKKEVLANKGNVPASLAVGDAKFSKEDITSSIMIDMKEATSQLDALRTGNKDRKSIDMSMEQFVKAKYGFGSLDSFYSAINVSGSNTSMQQLMTMPDFNESYRWLVPEVIREAVRLGMRKAPIYNSLIAAEETVAQPTQIMPFINLSDSMPKKLNEGETIPVGTTSFGEKTVKLTKVGTGIKLTDEVQQYVAINLLSLYLTDVGVKLGQALDSMAIDTLINGDQADGSDAIAVIGVNAGSAYAYKDFLRAWIRMGRLGKMPSGILSNEDPALDILELAEFKALAGIATLKQLAIQTPVPASQNVWIHGAMPATNQVMLLDTKSALIKLNSSALRVETERIASKQINGTYVTVTTGFTTMFRDARLMIDKSLAYGSYPFPSWMDAGAAENVDFKD